MTTPTLEKKPVAAPAGISAVEDSKSDYKLLRVCCWCVALALGAAQAWTTRFTMNPDGVSYLDIGDAYWRGDWHNAINAYWSPLYSWILGFFLKVLQPSMYWEYPLVHLVNFSIYVASLACFEFFLSTFIADRKRRDQELRRDGHSGLPEPFWWLLGYSLFISSSLILIGLGLVTPDLCMSGFVYLTSAMILKISNGMATRKTFPALGTALGFAYLTKAVMFPLGFVFLAVAVLAAGLSRNALRNAAVAALTFLLIAGPFIAVISFAKSRMTFGDSGEINYQIEVQRDNWFVPNGVGATHPVARLLKSPLSYEFSSPVSGTYPLWYDPSYWHEGVKMRFDLAKEAAAISRSLGRYTQICTNIFMQLNVALTLVALFVLSPSVRFLRRAAGMWPIWVPALLALQLYALVVVELRYVAPFLLMMWVSMFSGVRTRVTNRLHDFMSAVLTALVLTTVILALLWTFSSLQANSTAYVSAIESMRSLGVGHGEKLAIIGDAPEARDGAFVARLGRMSIVAEVLQSETFWAANPSTRSLLASDFVSAGASAILAYKPTRIESGWEKLADTDYYLYLLKPGAH